MSNDPASLAGIKLFVFHDVATCERHVASMDHFLLDLRKALRLQAEGSESRESIADHIERIDVARDARTGTPAPAVAEVAPAEALEAAP